MTVHQFEAKDDEQIVIGSAGISADLSSRGYVCTLCVAVRDPDGKGETTSVDIHLTESALDAIYDAINNHDYGQDVSTRI